MKYEVNSFNKISSIKKLYIKKLLNRCDYEGICEQDKTIKEVDAPKQSIYNDDHGKVINFIYFLM